MTLSLGPSILAAGSYASAGNVTTSGTKPIGTACPAGTALLAILGGVSATWAPSITDSQGNVWAEAGAGALQASGAAESVFLYTCLVDNPLAAGGTPDTLTFGRSATGGLWANVHPITGGADGTIEGVVHADTAAGTVAQNTVINGTPYSLTADDLVVVGTCMSFSSYPHNIVAPSGWSLASQGEAVGTSSNRQVGLLYKVAASGSVTPQIEADVSSGAYAMLTAALQPTVRAAGSIALGCIVL